MQALQIANIDIETVLGVRDGGPFCEESVGDAEVANAGGTDHIDQWVMGGEEDVHKCAGC